MTYPQTNTALEKLSLSVDQWIQQGNQPLELYLTQDDLLCWLGKMEDAIQILEAGKRVYPTNQEILTRLALHYFSLGSNFLAEIHFKDVLSLDSKNHEALYHLGLICSKTQRPSKAQEFFQSAAQFQPHRVEGPTVKSTAKDYRVVLLGYTNQVNTCAYPWKIFQRVFSDLGYSCEWTEAGALSKNPDKKRILICWNEPDAQTLAESGALRPGDVVLQKLTSLGVGCDHVNWGSDPMEFFKDWKWPLYKKVENLFDRGINVYAFGCKTNTDLFPEKHRIYQKLKDRIFWIPWGSSLYTWDEIQNAKPIMDGFLFDVGFVGSRWGVVGRGNLDVWDRYLAPLFPGKKCAIAGRGTPLGPVEDPQHKEILRRSRLCPVLNAASWKIERGVQDRFWTVFTTGRFGVTDTEGVYDFFNPDEVVCETEPQEYLEKSNYFLAHVEKQLPYIEKIQKRIKQEYNYYSSWKKILDTVISQQ